MLKTLLVLPFILFSAKVHALIGGTEVLDTEQVSKSVMALQMAEVQQNGSTHFYKASGVLIRQDAILTAGHNFFYLKDITKSESIFSVTPAWGKDCHGQKRINVKKVLLYPGFFQGPLGAQNDLAIVILAEPAPAEHIPLEIELDGNYPPVDQEEGLLLGYGRSSENTGAAISDYRLRRLELKFARWDNSSIADSQKIWFSNKNGSIAGGDSGGPVLFKRDEKFKIFGIGIHEGYDTCVNTKTCEAQSAYSNSTFFAGWIKKTIHGEY